MRYTRHAGCWGIRETSPNLRKIQRLAESLDEFLPQLRVRRQSQIRIMLQHGQRVLARGLEHFDLSCDVGDLQLWQAVLPDAEEFAGAAQAQVHFGDVEAVGRMGHGAESLLRR